MFCQKCGTQNPNDAGFCIKCGNSLSSIKPERKGIKGKLGKMGVPGFRSGKTWKMVLATFGYFWIGLILLSILAAFIYGFSNPEIATTPSATPSMSLDEIKRNAITVSYDDLMRNDENYIGKIVFYRGKVLQVSEIYNDKYALRVATKKDIYLGYLENVIWVNYKGKRLLEDDIIDIWGRVKGLKTYTAVLGNEITVPEIDSLNIELISKAGEK